MYAHLYPYFKIAIFQDVLLDYKTIGQLVNINHWVIIAVLSIMFLFLFYLIEVFERKKRKDNI